MSSAVDLLEVRLKQIEDRVLGRRAKAFEPNRRHNLMEELIGIEAKLKELTAGKERFNNCYQKSRQLGKYLDNEYIDRITSSDSSKLEQILNFEEQIRSEAKGLERVEQLAKNIDSIHIRNYDKLEPKLNKIRLISLEQSQESVVIEDKTRQLVLTYNQWLQNMKTQLEDWDQVLTQLENNRNQQKKCNKSDVEID